MFKAKTNIAVPEEILSNPFLMSKECLYQVVAWPSPEYINEIVMKVDDKLISLNGPNRWWTISSRHNTKEFVLRKLNKGESVTITQED